MTASPIVSVVCITYNQQNFIKRVIEGFLTQQVNFPIEIIISDDASDDGTAGIISEYAELHQKLITPIIRKKNVGQWRNLRESLSIANGKYVAYCEGDDFWTDKDKLQKQFDVLETNPNINLVWTDVDILHEKSGFHQRGIIENKILKRYEHFEEILLNKPFLAPCTWMFRSEVAEYFFKQSKDIVDGTFPLILDLTAKRSIMYLPTVTATYTKRLESASNSVSFSKRHLFSKGLYHIQNEYASKYNVNKQIINELKLNYYKSSWIYAYLYDDANTLKDARLFYESIEIFNNKKIPIIFIIKFLEYSFKYNLLKRLVKILVSLTFKLYHHVRSKCLK